MDPLRKPVDGRVICKLTDPDVSTTLAPVPLSQRLIVERCDVLAEAANSSTVRIGSSEIRAESTEARGQELKAGQRMTLPRTNLAWWYVTADTADDVVTWSGEIEVDDNGQPLHP